MHRCVCIWQYILQNYNYKLHFQNLSIYHIPHVFIETLATENLDVCTACDPWDSNIQLTMVKDRRWQIYPTLFSVWPWLLLIVMHNLYKVLWTKGGPKGKNYTMGYKWIAKLINDQNISISSLWHLWQRFFVKIQLCLNDKSKIVNFHQSNVWNYIISCFNFLN
jgi:hypothetical protein